LEHRQKDFLAVYDKSVKELVSLNIAFRTKDVCKLVAQSKAPRFYVSLEEALYQYRLYVRGKSDIRCIERRKMYAEIFSRYEQLMIASGGVAYQYDIMSAVLMQPAPSFYLSDSSAISFYYKAMKEKRKKSVKR
jgi:hypothetical protein